MFLYRLRYQHLNFQFGLLFTLNIALYILLAALFFLTQFTQESLFTILKSSLILIIALPLTGLNITALLEFFFCQKFTLLEKFFLATLVAFILPPLFLSIIYSIFSLYSPFYILILSVSSFLLALIANPQFLNSHPPDPLPKSIKWTLALSILIYTAVVGMVVTSYYALPDLDPYYWLRLYQEDYLVQALTPLNGYRPLFSSFSSIFFGTATVDFFAYFKYVLPFLFLTTLLPLTLIAKRFVSPIHQMLIFGLPFITPSFLLYTLTPIPQAILNLGIIFFCISLLHSYFSRNNFFFFTSGAFILGISLYHEAASFLVLIWIIIAGLFFKDAVKKAYQENPFLVTTVFVLLSLQLFKLFRNVILFFLVWVKKLFILFLQSSPNFSYPATYINIDGNTVGWGTPLGVLKYYSFYAGPVLGLILLVALILFFQKKTFFTTTKEFLVLLIGSIFFFLLAEILPRFFNIALLPERAWGFVALFTYCIFLVFLANKNFLQKFCYQKIFLLFFIFAFAINIGGALFINDLKQYLITPAQISSAEWIKGSLPEDRIIFTYGNESLLRTHAQSTILSSSDPSFYEDIRVFNSLLKKHRLNSVDLESSYVQYIRNLERAGERLKTYELSLERDPILVDTLALKKSTDDFLEYIMSENNIRKTDRNIYIYFAKPSALNPYSKRPYNFPPADREFSEFIFDKQPDHFKRVYALPDNEIVIWQYTP